MMAVARGVAEAVGGIGDVRAGVGEGVDVTAMMCRGVGVGTSRGGGAAQAANVISTLTISHRPCNRLVLIMFSLQDDRHWPIVASLHLHHRAENAGLSRHTLSAQLLDEVID